MQVCACVREGSAEGCKEQGVGSRVQSESDNKSDNGSVIRVIMGVQWVYGEEFRAQGFT